MSSDLLLGRYEYQRELGRGSEGRVIQAVDHAQSRAHDAAHGPALCALKCVAKADEARVRREHALLASIAHPNLAVVRELIRADRTLPRFDLTRGALVLVSELAPGVPADRAAAAHAVDKDALLELAWQVLDGVARALVAVHAQGFVHGDVKPSNVIVGEGGALKLIDLGLARTPGAPREPSGTPGYMAPELWRGELLQVADLFALGVTVWRLLAPSRDAGQSLTPAEHLARALAPTQHATPLPSWLPAPLAQLLRELCAPDPNARPASARALVERIALLRDTRGKSQPSAAGALQDQQAIERALRVTALPFVGQQTALAALIEALGRSAIVQVIGPDGAGRSRLVREAVGAWQARCAEAGEPVPTYLALRELPTSLVPHACVLHLEVADALPVAAIEALFHSLEVVGQPCPIVLERRIAATDVGWAQLSVGPASDLELERLLTLALPQVAVKAPLVREAMAVSGGLVGRLCRLLNVGLARGDELGRAGTLRGLVTELDAALELPEELRELAEQLAVCGGALPLTAAAERDAVQHGRQLHALLALGLCSVSAHDAIELRPDVASVLRARLSPARLLQLGRTCASAELDARARAFVTAALGETSHARAGFVTEIRARSQRGDPDAALLLASEAEQVVGDEACQLLGLRVEALRALGRYGEALAACDVEVGQSSAQLRLARAELLRLTGQSALAQQAAEAVRAAHPGVAHAADVILARLALDAGAFSTSHAERLRAAADGGDQVAARASEVLALAALQAGQAAEAETLASRALPAVRARADRAAEARLLSVLACVDLARGELRAAARRFTRAFELADAAGEYHAAASFLVNVGTARLDAGELGPALAACRKGAQRLARLGRERDLGRVLYNAALCAQLGGDYDVALALAHKAQLAAHASADAEARASALVLAAEVQLERSELGSARDALAALPDAGVLSAASEVALLSRAAVVAFALDDAGLAERCFARAERALAADGGEASRAEHELALSARARLALDLRAARDAAERALSAAKQRGELPVLIPALLSAARAAEALSDLPQARVRFAELRSCLDAAALTLEPAERARLREVRAYREALAALPTTRESHGENDRRWRQLASLAKRLTSEYRRSRLYEIVLDAAIDLSGAERAYLLRVDADGEPRVRAARGLSHAEMSDNGQPMRSDALSRSVLSRVIASGQALSTVDAANDARLSDAASVAALALRSVLAVPIRARGQVVGVLYLDDRLRPFAFGDEEVALLSDLADLAAIALEAVERYAVERRAARRLSIARERLARRVQAQALELQSFKSVPERAALHGVVAHSPQMHAVLALATRVARADVPVLVLGESGTGKELIARAIHAQSGRAERAFVSENCSAIPESLLESALFGHVKGAFTGADRKRVGLFEAADGGTLFLDEIGEMSPAMQVRLLRVLQDGEIRAVGAERTSHVDVRVIAATHRDLSAMVQAGTFREDLYYRLAVVSLAVPPLRDRVEDIAPLVAHFIDKHAHGNKPRATRAAVDALCAQSWPGNVRQLENEVRRALVLAGEVISEEHWSFASAPKAASSGGSELHLRGQIDDLERRLIRRALDTAKGNQTKAAELLGISRFGLQKMQKRLSK